jgi:hypothetical protein
MGAMAELLAGYEKALKERRVLIGHTASWLGETLRQSGMQVQREDGRKLEEQVAEVDFALIHIGEGDGEQVNQIMRMQPINFRKMIVLERHGGVLPNLHHDYNRLRAGGARMLANEWSKIQEELLPGFLAILSADE